MDLSFSLTREQEAALESARELIPHIPLHLSTQANSTNYKTVEFWRRQGVSRINMARELTLAEIKSVAKQSQMEIEAFVHGAMCIAYSGRCLLSSFMAKRHSNRGMCTHPCRWKYALVEETRAGQYMPFAEDDHGAYIFNSRDLCMIEHIPAMIDSGVSALKIEGRMKGINYLASVVKVYREAIDRYFQDSAGCVVRWKPGLTTRTPGVPAGWEAEPSRSRARSRSSVQSTATRKPM